VVSRSQVVLRCAIGTDAMFLAELWDTSLRRSDPTVRLADVLTIIATAQASSVQRLVVAEYDGQRAGAVLLEVTTVSSLNLEAAVRVQSPTVVPALRRHGVGRALMEAALAFADEQDVASLATAVGSGARESNRFMARLALSPMATYRTAPTTAVRARLRGQRSAATAAGSSGRQVTRIVAARRSMRRTRAAR
jgi:GNAT superfamily N-acetyltransferase